jgi:signal transduction histidine kinase
VVATLASVALTLAVLLVPFLRFAWRSPLLHVAIETAAALVALLAAFLVYGRARLSGRLDHLVLTYPLALLGASGVLLAFLPDTFSSTATAWFALLTSVLSSLALGACAFAPPRPLETSSRTLGLRVLGAVVATLLLVGLVVAGFRDALPALSDAGLSPAESIRPRLAGPSGVLALQLLTVAGFAAAALGFIRRADREQDALLSAFAAGSVLAAFARIYYCLFPSWNSDWVYTGDAFRLAFYAVLAFAGAREIRRYWARLADLAILQERRRLARELHDGLAQELAFIAREGSRDGAADLDRLVGAAQRALDESRQAIAALTEPLDAPIDAAVERAAEDVAGRYGMRLRLHLDSTARHSPELRDALVRIVREAITNAARHGQAGVVEIELTEPGPLCLRVVDDGLGFEPDGDGAGFGLQSMAERARALGGSIRIESTPGKGTALEVSLP